MNYAEPFAFNDHSRDVKNGVHAFLSPSQPAWLNYSDDKLRTTYINSLAKDRGTRLHALAAEHITLQMRMPRNKLTFNSYVNDAIGFGMKPEQCLYFSPFCYGTADSIYFDQKRGMLRIHDLKTGITPAHMEQLHTYLALFNLEYGPRYGFKPGDIETELRIYQNDDILVSTPTASETSALMDNITHKVDILNDVRRSSYA